MLVQKGYTEVQVVEVELNEQEERILNVSLNKISGRWDNEKLTAILDELKEQGEMALTGFDHEAMDKYIDENPAGKVELAQLLVNKAKGLI